MCFARNRSDLLIAYDVEEDAKCRARMECPLDPLLENRKKKRRRIQ